LEATADLERLAASADERAARFARAIERERLAAEQTLAAVEESAASTEAAAHEQAAKTARAVAADAGSDGAAAPARRRARNDSRVVFIAAGTVACISPQSHWPYRTPGFVVGRLQAPSVEGTRHPPGSRHRVRLVEHRRSSVPAEGTSSSKSVLTESMRQFAPAWCHC